MKILKFTPVIYKVEINSNRGKLTANLLTVDGETPINTIYFLENDFYPSDTESDLINSAIENEQWEKDYSAVDVSDFDINLSVFDTACEAYQDIIKELYKYQQ